MPSEGNRIGEFHPLVLLVLGVVTSYGCAGHPYTPVPLKKLGDPAATQVVATLDSPIDPAKNAVWCASFVAAWKRLQNDLSGGAVELDGASEMWQSLNQAVDPKLDIPESALYAVAGRVSDGIAQAIQAEVARRFPKSDPPDLPPLPFDGVLAYSRLEVAAKFPIPYFDDDKPLEWNDSAGVKHEIRAFGIREKDFDVNNTAYDRILAQPRILYVRPEPKNESGREPDPAEFIIDLNSASGPIQILIAQLPRQATLAQTLADVDAKCAQADKTSDGRKILEHGDALLVPEMAWSLRHHFEQLIGLHVVSGPLQGMPISEARQDIAFRLDRSGAEVKSEAVISLFGSTKRYAVTRPFLLVMRQRTSPRPFLVIWVENDELLRNFST